MIGDVDMYINFVLHAVLGMTSEADTLATHEEFAPAIDSVAKYLAKRSPIASKPIYRGILLDPNEPYRTLAKIKFMSWSEDLDVARWFAATRAMISEPAMQVRPQLRGYLLTQKTENVRPLFHHTWAVHFNGLASAAILHPFMGANGARQVAWALRTQQEVITAPIDALPLAVDVIDHHALDRKFGPPWVALEGAL